MPSIAIVVHTCDRYELLYAGFEYFFKKNWPLDAQISNYYLLTEENNYNSDLFKNIKTGKGEWSDRLKNGLQQIPEEFIIYFQEDMWLIAVVNGIALDKLISFVFNKQADLLKLNSSDVFITIPTDIVIEGLRISVLNNKESGYLMSHQVSVWKKDFLIEQMKPGEHPWRNERKGTKRLKKIDPTIYHADLLSENGHDPVNDNAPGFKPVIYRTISVNAKLNHCVIPFIDELKKYPGYIDYAAKLEYNFKNQLTHDGKVQPRKEGFFKKFFKKFKQ